MKNKPCPILDKTPILLRDLRRTLNRLENNAKTCQTCPRLSDCQITGLVGKAVRQAADEILNEMEFHHG